MTMQEKATEQLERVSRHLATIGEKEDYTEIAIQALEQECEDAVNRQAVLDIVKFEEDWLFDAKSNNADTDIAFSGIRTQVAKLSQVTPARKKEEWISCDEKLPKPNELVDNVRKYYLIQDEYGDMCVARYTKKGWHPIESLFFLDDVVAWIPLPKEYKAEMESEE